MIEALQQIAALQPEALRIMRENGFKFEGKGSLGKEPGNWQHLSFTFYSMLCEAESIASSALKEVGEMCDYVPEIRPDGTVVG